jgi:hypothetical protein
MKTQNQRLRTTACDGELPVVQTEVPKISITNCRLVTLCGVTLAKLTDPVHLANFTFGFTRGRRSSHHLLSIIALGSTLTTVVKPTLEIIKIFLGFSIIILDIISMINA